MGIKGRYNDIDFKSSISGQTAVYENRFTEFDSLIVFQHQGAANPSFQDVLCISSRLFGCMVNDIDDTGIVYADIFGRWDKADGNMVKNAERQCTR